MATLTPEQQKAMAEAEEGARRSQQQQPSRMADIAQSVMGFPRRLVSGVVGAPGDILEAAPGWVGQYRRAEAAQYDLPQEQASPERREELNAIQRAAEEQMRTSLNSGLGGAIPSPTSRQVNTFFDPVLGKPYQSQTPWGERARTASDFIANLLSPGTGKEKAAQTLVPMLSTLAAQELPEGRWASIVRAIAPFTGVPFGPPKEPFVSQRNPNVERRIAEAAPIPLTRGQATRDVAQQMEEQQLIHGGRGPEAMRAMQQHQSAVEQARQEQSDLMRGRMAPGAGGTAQESGENLVQSARQEVAARKAAGAAKIESALGTGDVWVSADQLRDLPNQMAASFAGATPGVPRVVLDATTPTANAAMSRIRNFVGQAKGAAPADPMARLTGVQPSPGVSEVSLDGLNQLRKNLNELSADPTKPMDVRALAEVKKAYNDWLDSAVQGGIQRGARSPQDVYTELKEGNVLYGAGASVERPRNPNEPGARSTARLVSEGAVGEDAVRALRPNKQGVMPAEAPRTLARLIEKFGESSDVASQARDIVLSQLLEGGSQAVAGKIRRFVEESGTSAERLFTPAQLDELRRRGAVEETLTYDPRAINPSKSSYAPANALRTAAAKAAGGLVGGAIGTLGNAIPIPGVGTALTVGGGLAGQSIGALIDRMRQDLATRRALSPLPTRSEELIQRGIHGIAEQRKEMPLLHGLRQRQQEKEREKR